MSDRNEGGFVLFEVLVAAMLLALIGTVAYEIGRNVLAGYEHRLDRTMATTNVDALFAELLLVGMAKSNSVFPREDSYFRYEMVIVPSTTNAAAGGRIVQVRISAKAKASPQTEVFAVEALIGSPVTP